MERLTTKIEPLMWLATMIGIVCGIIVVGLGAARYFGQIDMGAEFEKIDPLLMMAGGVILIGTFAIKFQGYRGRATAAREGLGK